MSRRSRKNEWSQMRDSMLGRASATKGVDARETVPETACGKCKHFSENAYGSDGRGTCAELKMGSDISQNPAVVVTDAQAGYLTFFNSDAGQCPRFERLALIDTDGTECNDPQYRRAQRQMERELK